MNRIIIIGICLFVAQTVQAKNCCPFMGEPTHCNKKIGRLICSNGMPSPTCFCGDGKMHIDIPLPDELKALQQTQSKRDIGTEAEQKRQQEIQNCYEKDLFKKGANHCLDMELGHLESKLNRKYKELLLHLGEDRKIIYVQSMKDWAAYKDSYCLFSTSNKLGNAVYDLMLKGCRLKMLQSKLEDIDQHLGVEVK